MEILSCEVSRRAVSGTRAGEMVIGKYQDGGLGMGKVFEFSTKKGYVSGCTVVSFTMDWLKIIGLW